MREFERFLMESVSDLNFEYEDGILKVRLYVAGERTSLRLSRGICEKVVGSRIVEIGRKKERP